jgi:hypothetical protein
MVIKAQMNNLLTSLGKNLISNGVAILQYADGTIVCLEHDLEKARNLKVLIYMFEQISGLKINFDKSEILLIGGEDGIVVSYTELFNCQMGSFPLRYLGVPIAAERLHVADWVNMEEKLAKKLDVWQGGSLSIGGRAIFINTNMSNSMIYQMSMYLIPKTNVERMDKMRRKFFWQGAALRKKYHLVRWSKICKKKKKGGLGIKNLRLMNISLPCKWWWLLETGDGLWQDLVKTKYVKDTPLCLIKSKQSDSPVWKDLLKVRHLYLKDRRFVVHNGKKLVFGWILGLMINHYVWYTLYCMICAQTRTV